MSCAGRSGPLHVPGERRPQELWLDLASGRIKPAEATSVTLWLAGLIAAAVATAPPEGAVVPEAN
jgi:hypothetical protein